MTARDLWRWTDERGVQRLVGTEELRSALTSSVLPASTLVWREGMAEWAPASTMPELATAAFAAGKSEHGHKVADEDSFDARGTLKEHTRRATLIGLTAPPGDVDVPPVPVPVTAPGELADRPKTTQIPPYGGPEAEAAGTAALRAIEAKPKAPAAPAITTPKPPAIDKPPPRRKPMTSDIDGLWATTTHSDEDETIPRRARPSELAAAAAATAEATRDARAKARLEALPKKDPDRSTDAKKPPAPPKRPSHPPPLPPKAAGAAGKTSAAQAKSTPPKSVHKTSPGMGRPPPVPPPRAALATGPLGVPVKPVVTPIQASVRIKPPGPQRDDITGESRTVATKSLLSVTLQGVAAPPLPGDAEQGAARAGRAEVTSTLVSAGDAAARAEAAIAEPETLDPGDAVEDEPAAARAEEKTETLARPSRAEAPEETPSPAAQLHPLPPARPPEPARLPLPSHPPRHQVVISEMGDVTPPPPDTTAAPPASTPPPPSATSSRSSRPPPLEDRSLAAPVTVPISSLLGAGGMLIGMVIAAFFVGRASAVPAPRLTARPTLGAVPALARATLPPPPKPCWMVKQPAMWAPRVSKSIPFEVAATKGDAVAVGYARDGKVAVGIEVSLATGDIQGRFEDKGAGEIERVVPTPAAEFRVARAGAEGPLRSPVDVPEAAPFAVGLAGDSIGLAAPGAATAVALWPLAGDEGLGAPAVQVAGDRGFLLTFRRGGAIWGGWIGPDHKAVGDLVKVAGSGGAVGKPAGAWNGREAAVIFADRPDAEGRYEIRVGHGPAASVPTATAVLPLPKGGPGGDAFSPEIAGLPDGRWLLMWTEGAAGSRAVRAQTLAPDFTPLGDPIALSPPAGNYGQGAIGVASGYAATVFLSRGEKSYELWGAVLQCM